MTQYVFLYVFCISETYISIAFLFYYDLLPSTPLFFFFCLFFQKPTKLEYSEPELGSHFFLGFGGVKAFVGEDHAASQLYEPRSI